VRAPLDVEDWTLVASDKWSIRINSTRFGVRQNEESTSSSGLDYDCDELGIDGTESRVPGGFGNPARNH